VVSEFPAGFRYPDGEDLDSYEPVQVHPRRSRLRMVLPLVAFVVADAVVTLAERLLRNA
jgi:hypothetical protein